MTDWFMERQFNNGDFEKLLRDNANQYRMYPSEKVWKGIDSALHNRRRWYGLSALIMFLITGSVVSVLIISDKPRKENISEQTNVIKENKSPVQDLVSSPAQKTFTPATEKPLSVAAPVADLNKTYLTPSNRKTPSGESQSNLPAFRTNNNSDNLQLEISPENTQLQEVYADHIPAANLMTDNNKVLLERTEIAVANNSTTLTPESVVDENTEKKINEAISALASQNIAPIQVKKRAKVTGQFYFTPTVSYRKLTENKRVFNAGGFTVPTIDLNNMVKHKPAMGLEFGFEGRYHVSKTFSIKTGLQFNINRYDISAYAHPTEIATVALNSGFGVDSLAALTNYRNSNSTSANWLENFYFQTSFPVGAELIVGNSKNVQWGISATIQPTYVIGDRAYVISSDYKNYAKFPDLMRRWNISTGVGTFVTYSTGRIRWQAGPHVRYQHLSSFVNELTIKEKLYAIGLKVGATLNKK